MGIKKPQNDNFTGPTPVPPEFDDAVVWAAWLYYADQMTQSEIAKTLNLSRATVVSLLQAARERGVVSIRINTETSMRTTLARRLSERFGLAGACITPSRSDRPLVDRLGDAGARVLSDLLMPGDVIGVAWGQTVLAAARAIALPEPIAPLTVVQVSGSSVGSADFSPELCTSLLASRLSARCVNLFAPALVSSDEMRERLLAEPALVKQFSLIRSANRILFGVGDIGPKSTVRRAELASAETIDAYAAFGAVGVIIGRFIGRDGELLPGELDRRMIGISLADLKAIPTRVCVAGGPEKTEALKATLQGGYVTHLVTDGEMGERLLD